jgi:hypothetical protein
LGFVAADQPTEDDADRAFVIGTPAITSVGLSGWLITKASIGCVPQPEKHLDQDKANRQKERQ